MNKQFKIIFRLVLFLEALGSNFEVKSVFINRDLLSTSVGYQRKKQ